MGMRRSIADGEMEWEVENDVGKGRQEVSTAKNATSLAFQLCCVDADYFHPTHSH